MEKDKVSDLKWLIILLVIVIFSIFLFFKINGYLDFTAIYGIERISCREQYNADFLIDDDIETTWGLLDNEHKNGHHIDIKFRAGRKIGKVDIVNLSEIPDVPVKLYLSDDGDEYVLYDTSAESYEDGVIYSFAETARGKYLRIENDYMEEGYWPITEIRIYE